MKRFFALMLSLAMVFSLTACGQSGGVSGSLELVMAAVGAATLVEERNMADTFYVQGIDGGAEILNYVVSGHADCTIIQDWLSVGTGSVDLAKTLYEGGTVDGFTGMGAYALYADGVEAYAAAEGIELG